MTGPDNETVLSCPPGDAEALARTIARGLGDSELRNRIGAAHDDDPHRTIGGELRHERRDRFPHFETDGVQPTRIAQDHPRDPVPAALDVDAELAHVTLAFGSSSYTSAPAFARQSRVGHWRVGSSRE